MITQQQLEVYLGRRLTAKESNNYEEYINITLQRLGDLLCIDLLDDSTIRLFISRVGYREVIVGPFTAVATVKVDGIEVTDYIVKQNNYRNAAWNNIIMFPTRFETSSEVEVTATWGFGDEDNPYPDDLGMLLAKLFTVSTGVNSLRDTSIQKKEIEDVKLTYATNGKSEMDTIATDYAATITKYGSCGSYLLHGGDCA